LCAGNPRFGRGYGVGEQAADAVSWATGVSLLLFIQPGRCADIGAPAQGFVQAGHLQRRGMAEEYLARKVDTKATLLQVPLGDAALEYRALTAGGPAELIAATTTSSPLVGIAYGAITSTDSRQPAGAAVTAALTPCNVSFAGFCGHGNGCGW
jgi:hypothetical protein